MSESNQKSLEQVATEQSILLGVGTVVGAITGQQLAAGPMHHRTPFVAQLGSTIGSAASNGGGVSGGVAAGVALVTAKVAAGGRSCDGCGSFCARCCRRRRDRLWPIQAL
jgi:hypothetical protein